jgi:DNA-binding NarL/FixJ family response regulator
LGVHGYLSKINAHNDLVDAIHIIKANEKVFPDRLYNSNKKPKKFLFVSNDKFKLSEREYEILLLIASGLSTKQIAVKLNRSEYTIETHRKNIGQKTGANSTAAIIKFAIEHNLPLKS